MEPKADNDSLNFSDAFTWSLVKASKLLTNGCVKQGVLVSMLISSLIVWVTYMHGNDKEDYQTAFQMKHLHETWYYIYVYGFFFFW